MPDSLSPAPSCCTVTTYRPRKISTGILNEPPTGQPLPLKDVSFVRQPGPGGKEAVTVVAATANQLGFKVHAIDVTDPRAIRSRRGTRPEI